MRPHVMMINFCSLSSQWNEHLFSFESRLFSFWFDWWNVADVTACMLASCCHCVCVFVYRLAAGTLYNVCYEKRNAGENNDVLSVVCLLTAASAQHALIISDPCCWLVWFGQSVEIQTKPDRNTATVTSARLNSANGSQTVPVKHITQFDIPLYFLLIRIISLKLFWK